eukprot:15464565-Alexandrium_andersonii.AAC.1
MQTTAPTIANLESLFRKAVEEVAAAKKLVEDNTDDKFVEMMAPCPRAREKAMRLLRNAHGSESYM